MKEGNYELVNMRRRVGEGEIHDIISPWTLYNVH